MDNFIEKWKNDKKFRTLVKLIAYTIFVIIAAVYALSLDANTPDKTKYLEELKTNNNNTNKNEKIFKVKDKYEYKITIEIDDKQYEYTGIQDETKRTIVKKVDNQTKNYVYKDNTYYLEDNTNYIITNKDEVYDVINYNYINLDTINEYLNKAEKNNNQYLVYLKDIILGNDSENYFVIDIKDKNIYIDYTVLMKEFNSNINKYKVSIEIKE